MPSQSSAPSSSSAPSEVPSFVPSSSSAPSESSEPSLAPSNSPRVTSLTVVEPDGVSKTVNCCESGDDNNECQALIAISEAESLDECTSVSPTGSPSKEVSLMYLYLKPSSIKLTLTHYNLSILTANIQPK